MPNPPTTYMLLVTPTDHDDDDVWGALLNTMAGRIDNHRHITGEGRPVPVAGMDFDTDVAVSHRITKIKGAAFDNLGVVLATGARELFAFGDDLYYRNGVGNNVPVTLGNALAMTTVGGIAGDYTSVSAEVAFVNASDSYTAKQQIGASVRQYAKWESADLHLFEYKAHPAPAPPTNYVGLRSPAALGATYTLTLPGAVPAGTKLWQVDNTGAITFTNTVADAVTFSSALTASALITANAGVTAGANQHFTVSGTGRYKYPAIDEGVSPYAGTGTGWTVGAGIGYITSTGANTWFVPLQLAPGEQITAVKVQTYGDGAVTATINVNYFPASGAAPTLLGTKATGAIPAAWTTQNVVPLTAQTISVNGDTVIMEIATSAAACRLGVTVYTRNLP